MEGALVVGPYVCPHRFADPCPCKKPNTPLYDRAAAGHRLKPADCFVIGDSPEDVRAAKRLGARGCLVRTGWATDPDVVEKAAPDASVTVNSLTEAAMDLAFLPIDGEVRSESFSAVGAGKLATFDYRFPIAYRGRRT